jgi:hypothetical protein
LIHSIFTNIYARQYSFEQAVLGQGTLFRYDFDAPDTVGTVGGSLGNDIETIIGPGGSGGSALTEYGSGFALVGINTFTEGNGGLFGDTGGGVALNDQRDWIFETTDLTAVSEPGYYGLLAGLMVFFASIVVRRK